MSFISLYIQHRDGSARFVKQRPQYQYQIWKLSRQCDIMADRYSTLVSYRWHTQDRGAPENTGDTLNKRRLLSTTTACYESVIRVHLLLWFTVWAGNTEMTTHTRIRMSLCGLSQSWRHTHTIKWHTACQTSLIFIFMAQNPESFHVFTSGFLQLHFSI